MDLQWQRQTELWLRLMGASPQPSANSLTLNRGRDRVFLEQDQGRARLTLARSLPVPQRQPTLLRLLQLLQPEAGGGSRCEPGWLAMHCGFQRQHRLTAAPSSGLSWHAVNGACSIA